MTVVDTDGLGGSAVLTDCVPSKTLIATAELMTELAGAAELGIDFHDHEGDAATASGSTSARVNARVKQLAADQSADIERRLDARRRHASSAAAAGSTGPAASVAALADGGEQTLEADAVLLATGAAPRTLPDRAARRRADPHLGAGLRPRPRCPTELIVVGSGVTGAEFASAYLALGIQVTLVS